MCGLARRSMVYLFAFDQCYFILSDLRSHSVSENTLLLIRLIDFLYGSRDLDLYFLTYYLGFICFSSLPALSPILYWSVISHFIYFINLLLKTLKLYIIIVICFISFVCISYFKFLFDLDLFIIRTVCVNWKKWPISNLCELISRMRMTYVKKWNEEKQLAQQ